MKNFMKMKMITNKKKKPVPNNGYNSNRGYASLLRVCGDVGRNQIKENQ